MTWQTVIGLEVHAQLKTSSKLFSGAATTYGAAPNSNACLIDVGLPGVLPVLNQQAVYMAIQFGLATHACIQDLSFFERKNYFYPDLPKGYQISQFQRPIVSDGHLDVLINGTIKKVNIARAHLEEDAGKSLHDRHPTQTAIDLNRAGTPLLEIVTTPCLFSAEEVICYLKTLHQLLRFLDICDGNMQEGSFRCDVNLSLRPSSNSPLGTRTELKNLNSFRFIEKAILYEQLRHQDLLETGQKVMQETLLYCPNTNTTQVLRSKENENDYRYFPDPDLLPIKITEEDLARAKKHLPPLPADIIKRLQKEDLLDDQGIAFLLTAPSVIQYYNDVKQQTHVTSKTIVNWLQGPYTALLHEHNLTFTNPPISPNRLACLLNQLSEKHIPMSLAKVIFSTLMSDSRPIEEILLELNYQPINNDEQIQQIIQATLIQYPQQANDYRAGKEKLLAFFVGHVMKQMKGQADPAHVSTLLRSLLGTDTK